MRALYTHIYVRWLLSGLCFAMAFQATWLWPFGLLGVWWFVRAWQGRTTGRTVFLGSWLAGTLKAAGAIGWYWTIYPLDWLGFAPGLGQLIMIGLYWATCAMAIGVGFAVVWWLLWRLIKELHWQLMLFPVVWIVAEALGSLTFSIFSLGPGIVPNIDFSFGYVGYLFSDLSMFTPFAQLGGVYGLTFVFVTTVLIFFTSTKGHYHS